MIIEKLKHDDLELYKNLMDNSFGGSNALDYYKEKYSEEASNYDIIVAKKDGIIVGSVTVYKIELFTFSFQPALELFNVAVLSDYRGQKIAQELFGYIIGYAKENNYKSIYLTCLDTAFPAHKLYESVGFKKMSSLKYSLSLN